MQPLTVEYPSSPSFCCALRCAQLTIAKLPVAKDLHNFQFNGTPITRPWCAILERDSVMLTVPRWIAGCWNGGHE